jgi:hypothetical protein
LVTKKGGYEPPFLLRGSGFASVASMLFFPASFRAYRNAPTKAQVDLRAPKFGFA